eukprot:2711032-Amphidinium_carterae.1
MENYCSLQQHPVTNITSPLCSRTPAEPIVDDSTGNCMPVHSGYERFVYLHKRVRLDLHKR